MKLKIIFEIRKIFFYLSLLSQLVLLYFNFLYWNYAWLGWILFVFFLYLVGLWWQKIFSYAFGMKKRDWITRLFACMAVFLLLGFASSIFVVWYKITPFLIWLSYSSSALLSWLIYFLVERNKNRHSIHAYLDYCPKIKIKPFRKNIFFIIGFLILWFVGLLLLSNTESSEVLNSPWQSINKYYLSVFFVLSVLLSIIVFSRHRVKLILFFIIMYSFLLHAYLPISHHLPWGGDVWRHIAIEQKLADGNFHLPVLFGSEAKWREVAKVDVPEALVIPNKYLYGQLWGSTVLLSKTLHITLLSLNKWLIPILWSIMLPLIFFRIGRILFASWRKGLVLAVLPSIAFPFQALGSLTLPVSLGYLTFFFILMLWLQYLRDERAEQRNLVFLFSFLLVFGYTLHFIIIWFVILFSLVIKIYQREESRLQVSGSQKSWSRYIFGVGLSIVGLLTLPFIEIVSGVSRVPIALDWFDQVKQLAGQFSGWFFASQIRPHDILSGNILFNHTPSWAYVASIFSDWRWHVMVGAVFIWLMFFYGMWQSRKEKLHTQWFVLQVLSGLIIGGYIVGWFILEGDRSFIRRLDVLVVFLLFIFLLEGFYRARIYKFLNKQVFIKPIFVFLILFFTWFGITTYASGPDIRVVSQNEYEVADYVLTQENLVADKHCVLADTWPLLILEGLSGQKIVGGGFPIDYQFGQTERVSIYKEMQEMPGGHLLLQMHNLTGTSKCFVALPKNSLSLENEEIMKNIMGSEGELIGDFVVWEENINNSNP